MAYIKISRSALLHNLEIITKKAGSRQKVAVVLKDNAYGHGLQTIAKIARDFGIEKAVVRSRQEALEIVNFFPFILILADTPRADGFGYAINDLAAMHAAPPGAIIDLKINTGMHRNGLDPSELVEALGIVNDRSLRLRSVFTHFRSADELSSELFWQQKIWDEVKKEVRKLCEKSALPLPLFHSANSATLFRLGCEDDFARIGIAMYGYLEMDGVFGQPPLRPVLSLWARRIATRRLRKGQRVGYGGDFEAPEDMVVSTYDCGYADGIFRALRTTKAGAILGRVSMDSISVAGKREEICVFDNAKEIAKELRTISYEVLVKLSSSLERIVCA